VNFFVDVLFAGLADALSALLSLILQMIFGISSQ